MNETPPLVTPSEGPIRHAENLIAIRRYGDALPWIRRAIAADPDNARPHCLLGITLLHLGQYRQALEAAETAVVHNPEDEWPHRLRSFCLRGLRKNRQALEAAQEAARLGPEVPEALFVLVLALLGCNQGPAAVATAERLSMIAPDRPFTHQALGHVALALRQWKSAETHFRRALALDPQDIDVLNALGIVLQRQGKHVEALERLLDATRLNPTAHSVKESLQIALGWYRLPAALLIALGALAWVWGRLDARGSPLAYAVLLAIAAVAMGWFLWRRARIRALPEHLALLIRDERLWGPLPTGSDRILVVAVVIPVATWEPHLSVSRSS